jgi:hypothetical protein
MSKATFFALLWPTIAYYIGLAVGYRWGKARRKP